MTHITKPVNYIMSILGKKYPETPEEFSKLQMTGVFDSDKAGKRMRLAIPETWETQVSARGNKAEVWQELLDHNKLPFMAMLRNLRNLIKAGISEHHHKKVVRKLIDEKTIIRSKQFPFRFFSAFVALDDLIKELEKEEKEKESPVKKPVIKKKASKSMKKKVYFTKKPKPLLYNRNQIAAYKKALGRSVKIATMYNVNPIPNKTLIFCNVSDCMYKPCTSARAFGQPKQMVEVGVLLGLMCQHACESSTFHIFHENGSEQIQLSKDNILERTQRVLKLAAKASGRPVAEEGSDSTSVAIQDRGRTKFPEAILWDLIKKQQKIDNLVILTREDEDNESQFKLVDNFLNKYRRFVNPNLLFVNVDLSGASAKVRLESPDQDEEHMFAHANDIYIAGFSEQLLQFIAERGNNAQLQHVSAIDKAYQLDKVKVHLPDPPKPNNCQEEEFYCECDSDIQNALTRPQVLHSVIEFGFRRVRVFISSTFRDMQMERELIVESLMPLLRKKFSSKMRLILEEVDLRWGVVAPENSSSLAVCLEHVQRCDLFVGLIGHRLGFCPTEYDVPLLPQFDWLREKEESTSRKSITQLEFEQAKLLNKPVIVFMRERNSEKAGTLEESVDEEQIVFRESIAEEHKNRVLSRYQEGDQNSFGELFEKCLSDYIQKLFGDVVRTSVVKEGPEKANEKQRLILSSKLMSFVGRVQLLKDTMRTILKLGRSNNPKIGVQSNPENDTSEARGALLLIKGDTGIGKSAFMASLVARLNGQTSANAGAFFHFSEPTDSTQAILSRMLEYLKHRFNLQDMDIPVKFQDLVKALPKWLSVCASVNLTAFACGDKNQRGRTTSQVSLPLLFFLDGLDNLSIPAGENKLSAAASNLDWVPKHLPKGCVIVMSVSSSSNSLLKRAEEHADEVINVGELNMVERRLVVQKKLDSFGKHLDSTAFNNQLGLLVAKREAASPLYLSYACDELRMSGKYEQLSGKIKALPQTVSALMESIVRTMEIKYDVNLVSAALLSLLLSPAGVTTSELFHVLSVYHSLNFELSRYSVVELQRQFSQQTSTLSYMWFSKLVTYLKLICYMFFDTGTGTG
ncbi:telomerase protein component 1-like [Convolutriloba macropyga]|uniref:telomerase protein component 1-like n=1 Tax=Convolutriloba macropyga TaxID=536237 RepID=UPI003F51AE89